METKINFSTLPADYVICWHPSCPLSANCLRHLAALQTDPGQAFTPAVNLRAVSPESGSCALQRPVRAQRNAYGLRNIYDRVPAALRSRLFNAVRSRIGNTQYYHYYNERRPITPDVQALIESIFREFGITEPIVFSRYEEVPAW